MLVGKVVSFIQLVMVEETNRTGYYKNSCFLDENNIKHNVGM